MLDYYAAHIELRAGIIHGCWVKLLDKRRILDGVLGVISQPPGERSSVVATYR